jgi:delta-aminolevulinic acid dehydratase/porphobilinogen synthase
MFYAFSFLSYQMNPANYREALLETAADEAEGADILLVTLLLYIVSCHQDNSYVCCSITMVPF